MNYCVRNGAFSMKRSPSPRQQAHRGIELSLEKISPEAWKSSPVVTRALVECPRFKKMVKNSLRRFGVSQDYVEEVVQDASLVMQTKVLANGLGDHRGQLRQVGDVYFVLYKVVDLTVMNYQKKRSYAAKNMVASFSEVRFEEETNEDLLTRVTGDDCDAGGFEQLHQKLDAQSARSKLRQKIESLGWPAHIPKERLIRGRPPKH